MHPMALVAVVIAEFALLLAPLAFIALVRYFDHKETMRRLERSESGELARLDLAALRMRERWRIRSGILGGACTAALGTAALIGGVLIHHARREAALRAGALLPPDAELGVAVGFGTFLILIGVVIMAGHLIWSRRSSLPEDDVAVAQSPTPSSEA